MLFAPTRRELSFHHGDSRLVGDLHLPPGASPESTVPAVVMAAGSGPSSGAHARNWEDIGARLAAAGLATFGYDKPGCGASTGDWTRLTLHDRAQESLAAVAALAAQPEVDGNRIGLFGGSQGGWVAPLAAAASDTILIATVRSKRVSRDRPRPSRRRRWRQRSHTARDECRAKEAFSCGGKSTRIICGTD